MRTLVNIAIVVVVAALFGLVVGLILPPPISDIVSIIGGFAIGWFGYNILNDMTNSRDQLR